VTVPGWVDTHCHLFLMAEDPTTAVDRAVAAGVSWMVCPGIDLESTLQARAIATQHPQRVKWSAGLHPHEASRWEAQRGRLSALALEADVIGECGLDYYRDLSPRDQQQAAFTAQVELASRPGKPIIVHVRDAFADTYDILESAGLGERAVMHCWTGGPRWTKRFDSLGVTFSFAGPITYETADTVRRAAAVVPPERTLVETDSPYLTPVPHRGEDNRPEWVALNGGALAEVWGVDVETVAGLSATHAARVFGEPAAEHG
jgi:TatD DNase family protein